MFLKSVRCQLQNTRPGFAGVMLIGLMVLIMMIFCTDFLYRKNLVEINYEYVDDSLTSALLAAAVINLKEYGRGGSVIIQEGESADSSDAFFANSERIFSECLKFNLKLDESDNFENRDGFDGGIIVSEYRVYNYILTNDGFRIVMFRKVGDNIFVTEYAENEPVMVSTTDGVHEIDATSIYADIEFTIITPEKSWKAFGFAANEDDKIKCHLRRLISVTEAEEL